MYDIQPGTGVGLFLQPRIPHGAEQKISWHVFFETQGIINKLESSVSAYLNRQWPMQNTDMANKVGAIEADNEL